MTSWFVTAVFDSYASACESGLVHCAWSESTGPLASLFTEPFFVLSRQYLKMRVLDVDHDVET